MFTPAAVGTTMTTTATWRRQPAPSFTPVSARRSFARPEANHASRAYPQQPSAPAQPQEAPRKVNWPPNVREYVQRCFAPDAQIEGIERVDMEVKLKGILTGAAENETLLVIDWDNYPLPQQIIQKERMNATTLRSNSAEVLSRQTNTLSLANPKKRKSTDAPVTESPESKLPPWRKATNSPSNVFEDRITYTSKNQQERAEKRQRKMQDHPDKGSSKYQADLEKRKQRFQNGKSDGSPSRSWSGAREGSPNENPLGPVVGTCQDLEKRYFRLTSAPKPEAVRPLHVLEKTLELLKRKWKEDGNYEYICDQFKSLRQDLTVQRIRNKLTVTSYEIHARIALEKADLGEYNQCQTQLRALYKMNLGGHPEEFLAYRILYLIHTCSRSDMNVLLSELTPAEKSMPAVQHALAVRSALATGNYHKFFPLYYEAPNMGSYLMDCFLDRERISAMANICKAYKPDIKVRFITEELGFESDQQCLEFMRQYNLDGFLEQKGEALCFIASKAGPTVEAARKSKFSKVDIKGQI